MKRVVIFVTIVLFFITNILKGQVRYDFIVAKDGSGNFKTVQEAINAVPDFRKKETIIFIKKGIIKRS